MKRLKVLYRHTSAAHSQIITYISKFGFMYVVCEQKSLWRHVCDLSWILTSNALREKSNA